MPTLWLPPHVQAPEAAAPGSSSPPLRRVQFAAISGTNPLDVPHWEAAGSEVAELAAAWQACGYALPLPEAAGAAWRKQAALQWHAQQWQQAPDERLRQVPSLLAVLNDAGGLELMQQQLSAAQPGATQRLSAAPSAEQGGMPHKQPLQRQQPDDCAAAASPQSVLPPLPSSTPSPPPASSDSAAPPPALDAVAVLSGVPADDLPTAHAALATALYRAVPASEPGAAAKRAALSTLLRLGLSPYGVHAGTFRQLPVPASQVQEALREVSWQRQRL